MSIVVPVHNREDLLLSSLASVQNQQGVAVEIVVVDDGSTDRTPEVVAEAARRDRRLRVIRTARRGPAAARNAGVAAARGDFLTFVDSDDLCAPGRISRQVEKLRARPDVVAVIGAILFFDALDAAGRPVRDPRHEPHHNAALQSATFRADTFRRFGPLDESLEFAEDVDFFLRLLEVDAPLLLERDVACFYRWHDGSMSRDLRARQQGYVKAYARSIVRRRAAGRTRPLASFFPGHYAEDTDLGRAPDRTLQQLRLDADDAVLPLYRRAEGEQVAPGGAGALRLEPDSTLRLDTFANSFYAGYWRELTGLRSISLALDVEGSGEALVRRRTGSGGESVVAASRFEGERRRLRIGVSAEDLDGVLGAEVVAGERGATVRGGSWTSQDAPRRDVRLAVVICCFAKPGAVRETVGRMADRIARLDAGPRVIVVDQGEGELELPPMEELEVVRQDNLGGSGGFTRGMLEALSGDPTHVLLLDDDVSIPLDLLDRLTSLLAHLTKPVAIGGQMLDLFEPTVLRASHEAVDFDLLSLRNQLHQVDLGSPDAPRLFARPQHSDYNAWWCCCIPAEILREELPLPMFVRHDDTEHGVRISRGGCPVVTMPGIFVWHEPFEAKVKPWYTYYDRRNMLILAALHGRVPASRAAALFLRQCWSALTIHRYEFCWAACRAVEDFLKGPEYVFASPAERHRELVGELARHSLSTMRSHRRRAGRDAAPSGAGGAARNLRLAGWMLRRDKGAQVVAAPARATARRTLSAAWRLLRRGDAASAAYRAQAPRYSSLSRWRKHLGLVDAPEPRE